MAVELVAALIVLLVLLLWPGNVAGLRQFGWYRAWLDVLDFAEGGGRVALAMVLPVITCALIAHFIQHWIFALAALAFAVLILRSEERRVGKSVDLGGRRIIKKKKRVVWWSSA